MITVLQDKLLAKMGNEENEKMPYSADDQVRCMIIYLFFFTLKKCINHYHILPAEAQWKYKLWKFYKFCTNLELGA